MTESIPTQSFPIVVSSLPNDPHTVSEVDNDLIEIVIADPSDTTERSASLIDTNASGSPPELLVLKTSNHGHNLPLEIIQHIIYMAVRSDFNYKILVELMLVSKLFRKLAASDMFWYLLFKNKFPTKLPYPYFQQQVFITWRGCYAYESLRRSHHPVFADQKLPKYLTEFILLIGIIFPIVLFGFAHTYWINPITKNFLEALETPIFLASIASLGYQEWIYKKPDRLPSWKSFWEYMWTTKTFRTALALQILILLIAMLASVQKIYFGTPMEVMSDILFCLPLCFWIYMFSPCSMYSYYKRNGKPTCLGLFHKQREKVCKIGVHREIYIR